MNEILNRETIRAAVIESIVALTKCAPRKLISDDDDLVDDLGVDSLNAVNLLLEIEDRVGVMLPDGGEASLAGVRKIGVLVARLEAAFAFARPDDKIPRADGAAAR